MRVIYEHALVLIDDNRSDHQHQQAYLLRGERHPQYVVEAVSISYVPVKIRSNSGPDSP